MADVVYTSPQYHVFSELARYAEKKQIGTNTFQLEHIE